MKWQAGLEKRQEPLGLGPVSGGPGYPSAVFHPEGPTFVELARQALSSTRRGYDLLAPKFDNTPFRTSDAVLERVAPFVGSPGSLRRAVDLCCGTGAAARMLATRAQDLVVGVDFSLGMLAEARRQAGFAEEGDARLVFVHGDVLDLELAAMFDLATLFGSWGHLLPCDQARFLRRVHRLLVPGGCFLCESAWPPPPWSPRLWFARAFNAAMALRNRLLRPPFVMYYLSFLLPRARPTLEEHGFSVEVLEPRFPRPFHHHVLLRARKLGPRPSARGRPHPPPGTVTATAQ